MVTHAHGSEGHVANKPIFGAGTMELGRMEAIFIRQQITRKQVSALQIQIQIQIHTRRDPIEAQQETRQKYKQKTKCQKCSENISRKKQYFRLGKVGKTRHILHVTTKHCKMNHEPQGVLMGCSVVGTYYSKKKG